MSSPLIYDLSLNEIQLRLAEWGEPPFRTRQIWEGLYRHLWIRPEEFTNLPKDLRDRLAAEFRWTAMEPQAILKSSDGETIKTLFRLPDAREIEAVLMRYDERNTLCISSQSGCAMGCVFCATGQMGFLRHLTSGEIVAQVIHYARQLKDQGEQVTNVVLMGMGEPFHNYQNTLSAIDRLNDPGGFNLGARRFTISTVGLVPMIRKFAEEKRQVNLAISLHAATDEERSALLPVNRRYPISEVIDACREYVEKTGRRVTFEWALIRGVNDTTETARRLANLLKGLLCHVNVIPLNPTKKYAGRATTREAAKAFCEVLNQAGIPCTIRIRRGIDIQAGCGQLATREKEGEVIPAHGLPQKESPRPEAARPEADRQQGNRTAATRSEDEPRGESMRATGPQGSRAVRARTTERRSAERRERPGSSRRGPVRNNSRDSQTPGTPSRDGARTATERRPKPSKDERPARRSSSTAGADRDPLPERVGNTSGRKTAPGSPSQERARGNPPASSASRPLQGSPRTKKNLPHAGRGEQQDTALPAGLPAQRKRIQVVYKPSPESRPSRRKPPTHSGKTKPDQK